MVEEGVEGVVGGGVKGTTKKEVIIPAWQAVLIDVDQAWTEYVAAVKAAAGGRSTLVTSPTSLEQNDL